MTRQVSQYHRERSALIELLGAHCWKCGSTQRLEFDHPFGRTWQPREMSSHTRMKRYWWEAERLLLGLLCRDCNSADGGRRGQERSSRGRVRFDPMSES